jgi:hypothetical protein
MWSTEGSWGPRQIVIMLYFICLQCDDRYVMDEEFVEVPDLDAGDTATRRVGIDYEGGDCLCPICDTFSGRLLKREE